MNGKSSTLQSISELLRKAAKGQSPSFDWVMVVKINTTTQN